MNAHVGPSHLPQSAHLAQFAHLPQSGQAPIPRHDATGLTEGGVQALIELNGQTYSLRISRAGKLILTK